MVARVGQDAFILLFENMRDVAEVLRNAGAIQDAFEREPVWTASGEESIALTLGLAINEPGDTPESSFNRADGAAIEAQSRPTRRIAVAGEQDSALAAMRDALRFAVTAGEVRTYVRPVVGLSGEPRGLRGVPALESHE